MSSIRTATCIFCQRECKSSDSRPHPNSKSKERIHNKCHIKKSLADKKKGDNKTEDEKRNSIRPVPSFSILDRLAKEESDLKRAAEEKKLNRLIEAQTKDSEKQSQGSNQFFFDVKAGIAKPHEKRRYLHHRNIAEIAARFDDQGFQAETTGRSYDHTGKDLNTLGEEDDESDDHQSEEAEIPSAKSTSGHVGSSKRKDRLYSDDRQTKKLARVRVDEKNPCWFCLSSPNVEKHLVVAIGDHCYIALAKGGLTDDHLLILPIEHIDSLASDQNSTELLDELENFKKSLVKMFAKSSKGLVFFERNFRSVHWQLQVVPIPLHILDTCEQDVKNIFKKNFKNAEFIDIPLKCALRDMIPPKAPYFFWQIEPLGLRFATPIQVKGSYFPIQIGRVVLADGRILNCTDRVDWKMCLKSKEEYEDIVKGLKARYEDFDIT